MGYILMVIDGIFLLGVDDKVGVVEIMEGIKYLIDYFDIKYGIIWVGFIFDEEIGWGLY